MYAKIRSVALMTGVALGLAGCTSYYRVMDPTTGKVYVTTELKQAEGATSFKDARTGDAMTLQNVEVRKISEEEYNAEKNAPPTTAPVK
jgi:hypothetical protein